MLLLRTVGEAEDGHRADVVLASWLDEPRARSQERLASGEVTVGGRAVGKSRRLRVGEEVAVVQPPPVTGIAAPPAVGVRYEDDHVAVVAKPAGLVVHAGAGVRDATLVDALRAMGMPLADTGDGTRPGVVHRLDRGTSGLLVVAKSREAARGLGALFGTHDVQREYWALVDGSPDPPRATVDAPIGRSVAQRHRFAIDEGGRRAVTHYDVEETFGRAALLRIRLETGRTHQVRVHMAALGHPVCGDRIYGGAADTAALLGLERPALHARRLAFAHPITGEAVDIDEPPPADLLAALETLRTGS